MCKNEAASSKTNIWTALVQHFFGKKSVQGVDFPSFEDNPNSDDTTLPPRNRIVLDRDRRYRHQGVDGWKIQGYSPTGNIFLTTDLYKHVDLNELRALNQDLADKDPRIGSFYRVRRSSGVLENFQYHGINPINQKLMMVKPEGHKVSVTEAELTRENWTAPIRHVANTLPQNIGR
jgi:hypothetical protein